MRMVFRSKYFQPAIHVSVWLIVLGVPALLFGKSGINIGLPSHFFLAANLYHVSLFYFNAYYLQPRLLNRRTWWVYFLTIPVMLAISFLLKTGYLQLADPSFHPDTIHLRVIHFPAVIFLFMSFIFRLVLDRIRFDRREKETQAAHLSSELRFLRSQINPHYLFNVLTNMVSLARKKSDLLEPMLIRLSDLLRYTLYETAAGKLPIEKEITSLKDYVDLQQLRFGDDVKTTLQIEADTTSLVIEPMLLIPFVENAYKHGVGVVADPFIHIFLQVRQDQLTYRVINNYDRQNFSKDRQQGIGLGNVKNRLQLLYDGKYSLRIGDDGHTYSIELKLQLS